MKIQKYFDKKEKKEKYKARFQLNEKEFMPRADSHRKLLDLIDEIRAQEHRAKFKLEVPTAPLPTVAEVFAKHQARLVKEKDRKKIGIFRRVSETFLKLLPFQIKTNELKKAHFQKYIDLRLGQKNSQSEQYILSETVNKELSSLSVAFK